MKRLTVLWSVFGLLLALSPAAAPATSVVESPEQVKARLQKVLDEIAGGTSPRVLYIPIREVIELSTAVYVERETGRVEKDRIALVLVEVHTPGGRVDAMGRICDRFRRLLPEHRVPVIAFINHEAFSAGAIISLSCDRIYIAPSGKVGAASVVLIGPQGPVELGKSYEEKLLSAYRAEARALAKLKGYPPALAMAMVDREKDVSEVEIDGKVEYLSERELQDRRRELGIDKLPFAQAEKRVTRVRTVCEKGELLTLDYEEAKRVGLAADILDSRDEVFAALGLKDPVVVEARHNWSEEFFGFFASTPVRFILLLLGLMGLYVEFKVPGFGLPGIFGLTCLGLFFFSQHFMGIADYTGIVVFLVGVILLLIEIFLIPGFGITGISGIALIVAGLFLAMQRFVVPDVASPWELELFKTNILVMAGAIFGMVVFMVLLAKLLPLTPFLKRLILTSQGPQGELRASGTLEPQGLVAVGATGKAVSRLRPAGRVLFGETMLDVVADGQFIGEGVTVEVIKVEGNRIVVRKVE